MQIISADIVEFLIKLDVKEIHGFDPKLGLRCFRESVLQQMMAREGLRDNGNHVEHQRPASKILHEDQDGGTWARDDKDVPVATFQSHLHVGNDAED